MATRQAISIVVATALPMTASVTTHGEEPSAPQRLQTHSLELTNEARIERELKPLTLDARLSEAAQAHAEDMLEGDYYGHVSPEGEAPMDRYLDAGGARWRVVRENIARCSTCEPPATVEHVERLHRGWMESPGHRRNLLGEGLSRFGFGAAIGARQDLYAVQMFAGPGTPRGLEPGEAAESLPPDEQRDLAVELINRARRGADVPPLEPSEALTEAAARLLPEQDLGGSSLAEMGSPLQALAEPERGRWRRLAVVAGECGGCGIEPTAADLRYFLDEWLGDPQYESTLLDASSTHLGFEMRANGEGGKAALAVLGTR